MGTSALKYKYLVYVYIAYIYISININNIKFTYVCQKCKIYGLYWHCSIKKVPLSFFYYFSIFVSLWHRMSASVCIYLLIFCWQEGVVPTARPGKHFRTQHVKPWGSQWQRKDHLLFPHLDLSSFDKSVSSHQPDVIFCCCGPYTSMFIKWSILSCFPA